MHGGVQYVRCSWGEGVECSDSYVDLHTVLNLQKFLVFTLLLKVFLHIGT